MRRPRFPGSLATFCCEFVARHASVADKQDPRGKDRPDDHGPHVISGVPRKQDGTRGSVRSVCAGAREKGKWATRKDFRPKSQGGVLFFLILFSFPNFIPKFKGKLK